MLQGRFTRIATIGTAAILAATFAASAGTADAASTFVVRVDGSSVSGAKVPANASTQFTVDSDAAFDSVTFRINGKDVATDATIEKSGTKFVGAANVNLSGLSGATKITARVKKGATSSSIDKSFTATAGTAKAKPGVSNTGVKAGTRLTAYTGPLRITTDNVVIENAEINGCIVLKAKNLTIKNSRIRCATKSLSGRVINVGDGASFYGEDIELDGMGVTEMGIGFSNWKLVRANIHSTNDGARLGWNSTVEDSWIHDMARKGALHPDCLQTTGGQNITVRNNTLDVYNAADKDLNNSAIMIGSETSGALKNMLIEGNYMNGGNYTLNMRADTVETGLVIRNNTFGDNARYGAIRAPKRATTVLENNTAAATGLATKWDIAYRVKK